MHTLQEKKKKKRKKKNKKTHYPFRYLLSDHKTSFLNTAFSLFISKCHVENIMQTEILCSTLRGMLEIFLLLLLGVMYPEFSSNRELCMVIKFTLEDLYLL